MVTALDGGRPRRRVRQKSGGVASVAGHRVEALEGGRSRLTLSVDMQGWLVPAVGGLGRRRSEVSVSEEDED
jgi:hypothetical protein